LEKRSLTIAGHRTSIALERAFWEGLDAMAAARGTTAAALIRDIDAHEHGDNLSSAVRVAVLRWYRDQAGGG
jgi:predicted DNA-binding ribbon-helix-helix protein